MMALYYTFKRPQYYFAITTFVARWHVHLYTFCDLNIIRIRGIQIKLLRDRRPPVNFAIQTTMRSTYNCTWIYLIKNISATKKGNLSKPDASVGSCKYTSIIQTTLLYEDRINLRYPNYFHKIVFTNAFMWMSMSLVSICCTTYI